MKKPLQDRLMSHVVVDEVTQCWNFKHNRDKDGYGRIGFCGKALKAHRVSYELFVGKIPEGLFVCHHCDNPMCINPKHLWVGTCQDNLTDRNNKGRQSHHNRGEGYAAAKLRESDVLAIISLRASGVLLAELAAKFGVSFGHISSIARGDRWKHLQPPDSPFLQAQQPVQQAAPNPSAPAAVAAA